MDKIPAYAISDRIRLLKSRFQQDITFEDFGLRHAVYQRVSAEAPGLPDNLRIARSYDRFLAEKSVAIHEHDLLAGGLRVYGYEDSLPLLPNPIIQDRLKDYPDLHPMFVNSESHSVSLEIEIHKKAAKVQAGSVQDRLLADYLQAMNAKMYGRWASGHVIAGYEKVVNRGVGALIREGADALRNASDEQRDSIESMLITDQALQKYILRYSKSAYLAAETTQSPEYRSSLLRIAQACINISSAPPSSFFEAIQLLILIHDAIICESVSGSMSLGRVDWLLTPFYERDLASGIITFDEAGELMDALWLKFAQMRESYQNVTLGGCDEAGKFSGNDLTIMGLRASRKLMLDQPLVSMRIRPDMPDRFWDEIQDLIETGLGFPAMFNDEVVFASKRSAGVEEKDLWRYGLVGCVENAIGGMEYGRTEGLRVNWAKPLELMLNGGVCACTGNAVPLETHRDLADIHTFDEFYEWYRSELRHFTGMAMQAVNLLDTTYGKAWPAPFLSSTMDRCYEKGLDVTLGGAKYDFSSLNGAGMADTVDSLCALRTLVFERKTMTLPELAEILKNDFEGAEPLRLTVANLPDRFGNDSPAADRMMQELTDDFFSMAENQPNPFGGRYQVGLYTVSAHAGMGSGTGALPDGRRKGLSLANAFSPCQGYDRNGPSAVIQSIVKSDLGHCGNGMVLDLKFNPDFMKKPDHRLGVRNLIRSYFKQGGMEIQLNVVSRETLIAAQEKPQDYRNLIVRVSGYSAYFSTLDRVLQNEIIARTEYAG